MFWSLWLYPSLLHFSIWICFFEAAASTRLILSGRCCPFSGQPTPALFFLIRPLWQILKLPHRKDTQSNYPLACLKASLSRSQKGAWDLGRNYPSADILWQGSRGSPHGPLECLSEDYSKSSPPKATKLNGIIQKKDLRTLKIEKHLSIKSTEVL